MNQELEDQSLELGVGCFLAICLVVAFICCPSSVLLINAIK